MLRLMLQGGAGRPEGAHLECDLNLLLQEQVAAAGTAGEARAGLPWTWRSAALLLQI